MRGAEGTSMPDVWIALLPMVEVPLQYTILSGLKYQGRYTFLS